MNLVAFTQRNEGFGLDRVVRIRLEVDHVRWLLAEGPHSRLRDSLVSAENEQPDRFGTVPVKVTLADFEPLLRIAMKEYQEMASVYVVKKGGYHKQQFAEGVGRAIGVRMTLDNVGRELAPDTHGYLIEVVIDNLWKPEFVI